MHPAGYCWSSYQVNAQRGNDELIKPHLLYVVLGLDAAGR